MSANNQQHRNLVGHRIADGRLELVSVLGLGAYGVVYLARDLHHPLHQQPFASTSSSHLSASSLASTHGAAGSGYYAVKCLNKVGLDTRQRAFQRREIMLHTMASNHANVVTLHRVIDNPSDPCVYVVLDYCPDGDLFSMITEHQRYTVRPLSASSTSSYESDDEFLKAREDMDTLIKSVFDQILDAVQYCHSYGIFHRDLKPENILCLQGGSRVVLADFGLATGEKMSADFGCGSTFYMGPECQGGIRERLESYNTAANDVWSLGVILVNLVCGRNPWKQACPADDTFREYLRNPEFLKEILPISDATNDILKRVFTLMPEARVTVPELRKMVRSVKRFSASQAELRARREAARAAAAQQQAARAAAAHAAAASHYAYKQAKHRAQNNAREAAYKAARIAQWEADERARQDFLRATAAAHAQQGSTNAAIVKKRQIYAQQADQVDQHSESDIPYAHSAEAFATGDSDDADGESESEMDGSCEEDSESWDSGSSCQVPIEDTSARAAHVRSHPCDLDHDFPSSSFSANSSENGSPVDWSQHPIAATPARVRRALISDGSEYELQSQDFAVGQEDVSIVPVQSAGRAGSSSHVHQDMHATESGESCPSTPCAQPVQTASNSPTSNQSPRTSDQRVMSPDSSSSRSGSGGSRRSSGSYTGLPPTPQFNPQQTYAQAQVTAGKGKGAVPAPFAEDAITGQQVVQVQVAHMPDTRMDVDFGLEALAIGPHGAVPKLVEDHDIPIQSLEPAGPSPPLAEGAVKIQKRRNVDGYVPAASRWVRRGLEEHRLENSSASRSGLSSGDETSSVNACTGRDSTMSFVSNALAGWDLEGIPANVFEPAQLNTPQPPQSGFAPFQHGAGRFCTMPSRRVRQPPYPKLTQASRQRRQVLPSPFGSQQSTFSQATPY